MLAGLADCVMNRATSWALNMARLRVLEAMRAGGRFDTYISAGWWMGLKPGSLPMTMSLAEVFAGKNRHQGCVDFKMPGRGSAALDRKLRDNTR